MLSHRARTRIHSCMLYTCVRGTVHAKKPAKVLLFFDMTKLFCKKMHFFCFFYEFSCFGGTYSPSDLYEMGYCAYKTGLCPKSKKMHLLHLPLYFGGNPLAGRAEKKMRLSAPEGTTNFCRVGALEGTPVFLCLSLLKGCLSLRGEGSLWQATGSNRALVAKKFTYR